MLGGAWLFDAFEGNIVGSVVGVVERLWSLSAVQSAHIVSLWPVGIMAGAVAFGHLADRFGRKRLFQATLMMYAFFTILTAFSWSYPSLLLWRFLTALGVGAEYSCINAAIAEFIPRRQRGTATVAVRATLPKGATLCRWICRSSSPDSPRAAVARDRSPPEEHTPFARTSRTTSCRERQDVCHSYPHLVYCHLGYVVARRLRLDRNGGTRIQAKSRRTQVRGERGNRLPGRMSPDSGQPAGAQRQGHPRPSPSAYPVGTEGCRV